MLVITAASFVSIHYAKKISHDIEVTIDTPADYTIMISNLPLDETEEDIKKHISSIKLEK